MNYSVQELPDDKSQGAKIKFEEPCFACGSHYCLMDCVKPKTKKENPKATKWINLSQEEKVETAIDCGCMSADWLEFANKIEAKLKEKNT